MAKNVLGRGLGSLIPNINSVPTERVVQDDGKSVGVIARIELSKIVANKMQPRQRFDDTAMDELKNSIKEKGVISPITVRRKEEGYEIIAGERRFRASKSLGLDTIPAYILDIATDAEMLELALIENVQRQNLDPIEVALGYEQLIREFNLSHDQVAEKVGKSRTAVTNALRLLKLPRLAQDLVQEGKITEGHARALISLQEHDLLFVLNAILPKGQESTEQKYSVRDIEEIVRLINKEQLSPETAILRIEQNRSAQQEPSVQQQTLLTDSLTSENTSVEENVPITSGESLTDSSTITQQASHPELEVVRTILEKDFSADDSEQAVVSVSTPETTLPDPVKIHIADLEDKLRYRFGTQTRVRLKADGSGAFEIVFANEEELERIFELLLSEQHQLS